MIMPDKTKTKTKTVTPLPNTKDIEVTNKEINTKVRPKAAKVSDKETKPRPKATKVGDKETKAHPKATKVGDKETTPRTKAAKVGDKEIKPRPKAAKVGDKKITPRTQTTKASDAINDVAPAKTRTRIISTYHMFIIESRPKLVAENPNLSFSAISTLVAKKWREVRDDKDIVADIESRRAQHQDRVSARHETRRINRERRELSSKSASRRAPGHVSLYNIYLREQYAGVLAKNPDASFSTISSIIGERWKKIRNDQTLLADIKNKRTEYCHANKRGIFSDGFTRKTPGNVSVYNMYVKEEYPSVIAKNPGITFSDVVAIISKQWAGVRTSKEKLAALESKRIEYYNVRKGELDNQFEEMKEWCETIVGTSSSITDGININASTNSSAGFAASKPPPPTAHQNSKSPLGSPALSARTTTA